MAQYDVRVNPSPRSHESYPYLVEVQSDGIGMVKRRIVVPLVRKTQFNYPDPTLNPVFDISGEALVLMPVEIAAVSASALGKVVGSLKSKSDLVIGALDLLFARH